MTLAELNQIKDQLKLNKSMPQLSLDTYKNLTRCIWIIQREIELKTKCTETKYSDNSIIED